MTVLSASASDLFIQLDIKKSFYAIIVTLSASDLFSLYLTPYSFFCFIRTNDKSTQKSSQNHQFCTSSTFLKIVLRVDLC